MKILRKTPATPSATSAEAGFAIIALIILALGIGATTVMFTVINGVLLEPLEFPNPDQLTTLHGSTKEFGEFWGFSGPDAEDVAKDAHSFIAAAWIYGGGTISSPGEPEYVLGRQVTANFFSTLGVPMREGRGLQRQRGQAQHLARGNHQSGTRAPSLRSERECRRFPTLVFEGKSYTVVGIFPSSFRLEGNADIFTPLHQNSDTRAQRRGARFATSLLAATLASRQPKAKPSSTPSPTASRVNFPPPMPTSGCLCVLFALNSSAPSARRSGFSSSRSLLSC